MPQSPGRIVNVPRIALALGPVAALAVYLLLPETYINAAGQHTALSHAARATLAMMCWMALWWMTEAVAIEATALLPLVLFPLLGIASVGAAAAPYASDIVFLFLGGFMLAAALQRWQVDRRMAWSLLKLVGTRQDRIIGGVMAATAFVSMWVSNTATAAMMLPIALALIAATNAPRSGDNDFAQALLLSVAYAASLGGIGTLIGSPPNGIAARFIAQTYGIEFSFIEWLQFALPIMLVMLPLTWFMLTRVLFRVDSQHVPQAGALAAQALASLGPLTRGARITLAVFAITVLLWITRPLIVPINLGGVLPLAGLTDAWIAAIAALMLLVLPAGHGGPRVLDWQTARQQPWGVLILFGGGLSLAAAIERNGVAQFIASGATHLAGWPAIAILLVVVASTVFLSELTSNTAQVATLVPILAAVAPGLGIDPLLLILPCAIAASCAFMMPVGTPPNAIVFGTGLITLPRMCKTGVWLNLAAIIVITLLSWLLVPAPPR